MIARILTDPHLPWQLPLLVAGAFFCQIPGVTVDALLLLCFNRAVKTEAYIALGSNLGDRELNLLRAVAEAGRLPDSRVTGLSAFYETSPVGNVKQDPFYNAVLRLTTKLAARPLLASLLDIENTLFKRVRTIHQGPRRMDLDLLLYGTITMNEENLIIPHPRLAERRFVLQPLCDIAPDLIHPVIGKTMRELLDALTSDETVVKL
jgi:2-amino-4-hydroxy-6-hydroxymethyldihydropteridine diphosphokinase